MAAKKKKYLLNDMSYSNINVFKIENRKRNVLVYSEEMEKEFEIFSK